MLPGKKAKGTLADRSKHNGVPADLKRTAQLYALQGVEHVHMTGRQMEAMMAEKQEEGRLDSAPVLSQFCGNLQLS